MEHFGSHTQPLREALGAARHHHELLEVHLVVGVRPTVEHVHHRHRQYPRGLAAQIAPQRQSLLGRLRMGSRQRHAKDRVGAEPGLVRRTVELDQRLIKTPLIGCVEARNRRGDLAVGVRHGTSHALALPALAAVTQLLRLELARGGS
jgi:hypothetical protein